MAVLCLSHTRLLNLKFTYTWFFSCSQISYYDIPTVWIELTTASLCSWHVVRTSLLHKEIPNWHIIVLPRYQSRALGDIKCSLSLSSSPKPLLPLHQIDWLTEVWLDVNNNFRSKLPKFFEALKKLLRSFFNASKNFGLSCYVQYWYQSGPYRSDLDNLILNPFCMR